MWCHNKCIHACSQSPIFLSVSCFFWVSGWLLGTIVADKEGRETGRGETQPFTQEGNSKLTQGPAFRAFMTNNPDEFTKDRDYLIAWV